MNIEFKIYTDHVQNELDTLSDIAELWVKVRGAGRDPNILREMLIRQCEKVVATKDAEMNFNKRIVEEYLGMPG